ncbi:polysaccharide chain length determinant protein, PEP-CTERM locus subfamily [Syntrophus gentianae]|uniref:Polysaccharide chain length determinant protein, PEP-CTERM locus subfamily n=2 Tax=Syntrophus gentianae TaxID=43775 RepID=A0A1H7YA96_9BACT|nr:polysaccharide chain length determinant protein, PEP-CTERM locus subfamily [Syntrophus gentianae]
MVQGRVDIQMQKQMDYQELKNLISQLMRRRGKTFLVTFFSLLSLIVITAFVLPPVYVSKSTILIEAQQIPQEYVRTSVTSYVEERLTTISQQIMSRAKLLEIINQFNLYPEMRKTFAIEEIIGNMRNDINLETISTGSFGKKRIQSGTAKAETTIAFTLSYSGKDPATVQKVASVLASLYLEENFKKRGERAAGITEFLNSQLNELKKQMDGYANQISALKSAHMGELPEHGAANIQALDQLRRDLDQVNAQIRTAQERKIYLESQLTTVDQFITNKEKGEVEQNPTVRLETLRSELINRQTTLSDKHPDIIRLKREIRELEKQMAEGKKTGDKRKPSLGKTNINPAYTSLKTQIETAAMDIRSLQQQGAQIRSQMGAYQGKLNRAPMIEADYKGLLSDYENAKNKYNDIMNKLLESRVAQGMEESQKAERFTIIESAAFPEKADKPNRPRILLAGLILSLFGSIVLIVTQESLDKSIKTETDLHSLAGVPVLSVIPFMSNVVEKRSWQLDKKTLTLLAASLGTAVVLLILTHVFLYPLDSLWIRVQRKILLMF